jgi:hypothetical protein
MAREECAHYFCADFKRIAQRCTSKEEKIDIRNSTRLDTGQKGHALRRHDDAYQVPMFVQVGEISQ